MPQTIIRMGDSVPKGFLIESEEQLNADPVLNELYQSIENKREFDFSKYYS